MKQRIEDYRSGYSCGYFDGQANRPMNDKRCAELFFGLRQHSDAPDPVPASSRDAAEGLPKNPLVLEPDENGSNICPFCNQQVPRVHRCVHLEPPAPAERGEARPQSLNDEIHEVMHQVDLTMHREENYYRTGITRPTAEDWKERVRWLYAVLLKVVATSALAAPAAPPETTPHLIDIWEKLDAITSLHEEAIENIEFMRAMRVSGGGPAVTDDEPEMPCAKLPKSDVEFMREQVDWLKLALAAPAAPPETTPRPCSWCSTPASPMLHSWFGALFCDDCWQRHPSNVVAAPAAGEAQPDEAP